MAGTEDIAFFYIELVHNVSGSIEQPDGPVSGSFKGLVVGTVFFCFFGHEPNIGNGTHCSGIKLAVLSTKINGRLIDTGITAVRDHC